MSLARTGVEPDPVLVHEDDLVAAAERLGLEPGQAPRRVGVEPDLVLGVRLREEPVVHGPAEGVERGAAGEQAERARRALVLRPVDRERVEAERLQLLREELDLAALGGGAHRRPLLLAGRLDRAEEDALRGELVVGEPLLREARLHVLLRVLPREPRPEADPGGELLRDPPARLRVALRLDRRLPDRDEGLLVGGRGDVVVALEVGRLGQHHVGPAGDLGGEDVHHPQELEVLHLLDELLAPGHRLDEVAPVDEPGLEVVERVAGLRRVAQAAREHLRREGVRRHALRLVHRRRDRAVREVGGERVGRERELRRGEVAAAAAPAAEERGEHRHGALALGVVAVPDGVAAGVDERGRARAPDEPRGGADQPRVDAGDGVGPLRRLVGDVGGELGEALGVLRDVVGVVAASPARGRSSRRGGARCRCPA